jgi:hypothetical protein
VKHFLLALALCAGAGVVVADTGKPFDPNSSRAYQDARKDYDKLLSDCARVPVLSEEYRVMCQELPERRPVAPH